MRSKVTSRAFQLKLLAARAMQLIIEQSNALSCPRATQDIELNTKNRNATREKYAYGPMNPLQPSEGYWESLAEKWEGATVEEAQGMRCGNCVAFDIAPRMLECLPMSEEQTDPEAEMDPMDLADRAMEGLPASDFPGMPEDAYVGFGYCWMHHFKCHSARSCETYAAGGPIETDEASDEWQEKNKGAVEESLHRDHDPLNEYVVPMGFSLKRWKKYRKKNKITNKKYHEEHPGKKWKVVHGNKKGEVGKPVNKGAKNLSYDKANDMHQAIVVSKGG